MLFSFFSLSSCETILFFLHLKSFLVSAFTVRAMSCTRILHAPRFRSHNGSEEPLFRIWGGRSLVTVNSRGAHGPPETSFDYVSVRVRYILFYFCTRSLQNVLTPGDSFMALISRRLRIDIIVAHRQKTKNDSSSAEGDGHVRTFVR